MESLGQLLNREEPVGWVLEKVLWEKRVFELTFKNQMEARIGRICTKSRRERVDQGGIYPALVS
jgi:hypothetical protein